MTSVPTTKPPPGFWAWSNPYELNIPRPYQYEFVEVWRPGTMKPSVVSPHNIPPMTNVAYWYWRPVKAFGEEAN